MVYLAIYKKMLTNLEILRINPKIKVIDKGRLNLKWFDGIENTLKWWKLSAVEYCNGPKLSVITLTCKRLQSWKKSM